MPPQYSGTALALGSPQPSVLASSSYSSVPTDREAGKPWDVYQKQLSSLSHGIALWDPRPVEALYDCVSIGDVGYIIDGTFYRMFNVTLLWNDPSNTRLGKPEPYEALNLGQFFNVRRLTWVKGDHYSRNVSTRDVFGEIYALSPSE